MGVSIYYTAHRSRPLTAHEQGNIASVVARYPLETLLTECGIAESEYNGEAFCIYIEDKNTEPGVVFEGATKLPLCSEDAFWAAVQYWCHLLTEVKRVIPDAAWHVHVDDLDIPWNEELRAFDPSLS